MRLTYTDADIAAKAVQLGLISDGEPLPPALRSKVVAALLQEQTAPAAAAAEPQLAQEIVVQPNGVILIDGEPFPWLVAKDAMDVRLNPDGVSTIRMTLLAGAVQIIKPEPREDPR
ncbi:hypothetical protein AB0E62_34060 [Streptomyces sp. NPDC038707]|uniref:hypothetical protein n=1 Tax=Streptomyces sp. NPDC038707 TaxID=3154329 RepID=UPI0033C796BD